MFSRTSITAILCLGWFVVPLRAVPLPDQRKPEPGEIVEIEIAKGVKMKFCWIPAGKAQLGSPKSEQDYVTKNSFGGKRPDWFDDEIESKLGEFSSRNVRRTSSVLGSMRPELADVLFLWRAYAQKRFQSVDVT
jgi:hypothetical protein